MSEISICYNKLWKLLIDRKLSQAAFRKEIGVAHSTIAKLKKDESVSMELLMKICSYLDCDVGDVLSFVKIESPEAELPVKTSAQK